MCQGPGNVQEKTRGEPWITGGQQGASSVLSVAGIGTFPPGSLGSTRKILKVELEDPSHRFPVLLPSFPGALR